MLVRSSIQHRSRSINMVQQTWCILSKLADIGTKIRGDRGWNCALLTLPEVGRFATTNESIHPCLRSHWVKSWRPLQCKKVPDESAHLPLETKGQICRTAS